MRLKWPKSKENPKKITRLKFKKMLRKLQFIFFTCQKLILAHFCKLSYKDRDLWRPNNYRVACFSHVIPAKGKKIPASNSRKVKKIEPQGKKCFSYKKKRV